MYEELVESIGELFSNYTLHPSNTVVIWQGEEIAVVMRKGGDSATVSYRRDGNRLEYRKIAGRVEHIERDLKDWKERVS